jgi:hypothetical protein
MGLPPGRHARGRLSVARLHAVGFVAPRAAWWYGHREGRAWRLAAQVVTVLAVATLLAAATAWLQARQALDQARAAAAAGPARAAAPPPAAPPTRRPNFSASERARINQAVAQLNVPWASIFRSLEAQATGKVAVMAIEPDAERATVRVSTEGPTLDALLEHAERVQAAPPFAHARLLSIDSEPGAQGRAAQLTFELRIER